MNARDLALIELDKTRLPGWRTGLLRARRTETKPDPRDRALAEQIRIGVIKNHLLLLHLIEHHSGRTLASIHEVVQKILSIALYQIRFLDRIPQSAAVDEAVEQTRRFGQKRAAGFVNAVLRNALRNPDPQMSDDVRYSHPRELLDRLIAMLGRDRAIAFCKHDNAEPPTIVRLIDPALKGRLGEAAEVTPHEQEGMYLVEGAKRALFAEWAQSGVAQVQDPTAAMVVEHLEIHGGDEVMNVLDRCAGMGTKTLQIAEKLGPKGSIGAIEPNKARCEALKELAIKRDLYKNLFIFNREWLAGMWDPDRPHGKFHRVLVDVPCSNSGVLARRPEARYAQDERTLRSLQDLQTRIMDDTAPYVRPGGLLIYSTCSVWPEENEGIVAAFLSKHADFEQLDEHKTLPSFDGSATSYRDGGYFSVLRRRG